MKELILSVIALATIVITIALFRASRKKNPNGVCDIECTECSENDWCALCDMKEVKQ